MASHRISKLILLTLLLASLSGCQIGDENLSASNRAKTDKYDSSDVTATMLEADGCMFFEGMYFARGEEKDHVFRFAGDEITDHITCPKAKFDVKNFDDVIDQPLFDVIKKIGIPSFKGLEKDHSLTYLCKDGLERSLSIALDEECDWIVNNVEERNIRYYLSNYVDEESSYSPSVERCKKIKLGMYLSDVLFMLGRPHKFSESNGTICCWSISSGGTIHIDPGSETEGNDFFDPSVLCRDDYFNVHDVQEGSRTTTKTYYWSVYRFWFNEKGIDAYPGGAIFEK